MTPDQAVIIGSCLLALCLIVPLFSKREERPSFDETMEAWAAVTKRDATDAANHCRSATSAAKRNQSRPGYKGRVW